MSHRLAIRIIGLCLSLVVLLQTNSAFPGRSLAHQSGQTTSGTSIYLPIVMKDSPPRTVFGTEMIYIRADRGLADVVDAGTTWVRRNGLAWKLVEPAEGAGYRWDAPEVRELEEEILNASKNNLKLMLIVRGSPRWATVNGSDCAPIKQDYYDNFANFLHAAVERYSKPPFSVRYWEVGNEPDAPIQGEGEHFYGCWGDPNDQFYGGRAYGEMLKVAYPRMKAANPNVQVLNGGLLLGDLADPSANFIKGMFAAGSGSSFDILAYHGYSYYDIRPEITTPDGSSARTPDGHLGAVDLKVAYLRRVMDDYGVPQKPLFNNEGALLCGFVPDINECRQAQADGVGRLYARAIKDGLVGVVWYLYDSDGFNNSALVEPANPSVKRTSYFAYKHAAAMVVSADYLGPLTGQAAGVEGYRFRYGSRTITIFWSNTPQSATISVGAGATVACSDRVGAPIACTNSDGVVTLPATSSPRYVVAR